MSKLVWWYILRWVQYWAELATALVGIATFGFVTWDIHLRVMKVFLDYRRE